MTVHCIFRRADGVYESGARWAPPEHDDGTHIALVLPSYPDPRTECWDGAAGIRAATAQEIAAYDEAAADQEITATLSRPEQVLFRDLYWNLETRLRLLGSVADDPALPAEARTPELTAPTRADYTQALKTLLRAIWPG